jgi:hypothetical protein
MLGREFESGDALLDWLPRELESIRPHIRERVFESWITRVEKCIEHEEAYFSEDDRSTSSISSESLRNRRC